MSRFSKAFRSDEDPSNSANPLISFILGAVLTTGGLVAAGMALSGGPEHNGASVQMEFLPKLFALAESGTDVAVRQAIRSGEFVNAVCPELIFDLPRGCSPLMVAARFGRCDVIAELRRGGALLNARAQNGWTALHVAAVFGHADVIDALGLAGEDLEISVPMRGGMTAAEAARAVGNIECAERIEALLTRVSVAASDGPR